MATQIFVNLPVANVEASKNFFAELGFRHNPQFSDDNAVSIAISDDIYAMLLAKPFFQTFTKKEIVDSTKSTEAIMALTVDSREKVDELVDKAMRAGAKPSNQPMDEEFMYSRSFQDPDGHLWEIVHMDSAAVDGSGS